MPRSSHHKSHRSHKHSSRDARERERSESEDDMSSRHRKPRVEEPTSRVSRDVEADKAKPSSLLLSSQERSKGVVENGDCSAERGRRRKERGDGCVTPDRWNGSGKDDGLVEKGCKDESFGLLDAEKVEKAKVLSVESKSRSRRREGSAERYGGSEGLKRRSEKEGGRREIREEKERDVERVEESEKERERASEREKRAGDGRHGKSDDVEVRSQGCRRGGGGEEERLAKKDSTGKVT